MFRVPIDEDRHIALTCLRLLGAADTRLETLGHARTGIHTADLYIHDYPLNRLEDWVEEWIAARTDD